jgi:dTDP-4-amino-4,6-dideoxygalactose transaminase
VPVLVDINPDSGQIDTAQLDAARSSRTKAIIASHLHGGTVAMPALRAFADQHGLTVIEDACQMPGAAVQGRVAGTWGNVGVLSFGGSKLLTAGRGGALVTRDADIVQRIRLQTQRGNDAYPLSELQAAVLVPQLDRLAERNQLRSENVARLRELLSSVVGLRSFAETESSAPSRPGFYKLGFWFDPTAFGCSREDFACGMRAAGIAFDPGFRALHLTHARGRFRAVNDLPHATCADETVLVLHHPVLLGNAEDLQAIRSSVAQAFVASRIRPDSESPDPQGVELR